MKGEKGREGKRRVEERRGEDRAKEGEKKKANRGVNEKEGC